MLFLLSGDIEDAYRECILTYGSEVFLEINIIRDDNLGIVFK